MNDVEMAYAMMFVTIWKHDQAEQRAALAGCNPTFFF